MSLARLVLLVLAGALSGCISYVTVEPAGGKAQGIPFSLAEPYLLVEPQPDGSASYTWVYLPNESRRYVVRPVSVLAKQTFEIELSHGMLSKATSKPDASDVASKMLEGAGNVYEQREKKRNESEKAQLEAVQEAEQKRTEALAAAQKEVADATLEHRKAVAKTTTYEQLGIDGDKLAEAKVAVATAEARLEVAKDALAALLADPMTGSMNAPGAGALAAVTPAVQQVAGPMLFRVIQSANGHATLRAVGPQWSYPTSTTLKKKAPASIDFTLSPKDDAAKHASEIIVHTTAAVGSVDPERSILTDGSAAIMEDRIKTIAPTKDKGDFKVTFKSPLPAGTYSLSIAASATAGAEPTVGAALEFTVGAQ